MLFNILWGKNIYNPYFSQFVPGGHFGQEANQQRDIRVLALLYILILQHSILGGCIWLHLDI